MARLSKIRQVCVNPQAVTSDVVLCPLDMLSLILSADQTYGCKSTPMAYTTKVQYRAGEGEVIMVLRLYGTKLEHLLTTDFKEKS